MLESWEWNANPFVLFQVPKGRDFNKAQTEIMATRLSIAWTWSTQSWMTAKFSGRLCIKIQIGITMDIHVPQQGLWDQKISKYPYLGPISHLESGHALQSTNIHLHAFMALLFDGRKNV